MCFVVYNSKLFSSSSLPPSSISTVGKILTLLLDWTSNSRTRKNIYNTIFVHIYDFAHLFSIHRSEKFLKFSSINKKVGIFWIRIPLINRQKHISHFSTMNNSEIEEVKVGWSSRKKVMWWNWGWWWHVVQQNFLVCIHLHSVYNTQIDTKHKRRENGASIITGVGTRVHLTFHYNSHNKNKNVGRCHWHWFLATEFLLRRNKQWHSFSLFSALCWDLYVNMRLICEWNLRLSPCSALCTHNV